jgi:hypothetical protein
MIAQPVRSSRTKQPAVRRLGECLLRDLLQSAQNSAIFAISSLEGNP